MICETSSFDAALRAVLNIVHMPNRRALLVIKFIQQNNGNLSKGESTAFAEISDDEIEQIERTIRAAWLDVHQAGVPKRQPSTSEETI